MVGRAVSAPLAKYLTFRAAARLAQTCAEISRSSVRYRAKDEPLSYTLCVYTAVVYFG